MLPTRSQNANQSPHTASDCLMFHGMLASAGAFILIKFMPLSDNGMMKALVTHIINPLMCSN